MDDSSAISSALAAARAYRTTQGPRILRDFAEWLALPNIAGDSLAIQANAAYLAAQMERRGIDTELWQIAGMPPVVFGERRVPGADTTLLFYAHYDGQPAEAVEWTAPPWTPTLFSNAIPQGGQPIPFPADGAPIDPNSRIYARSASDDKAPFTAILTALDALEAAGLAPRVNLKFFFDGEEETGSPTLGDYLAAHRDRLAADILLICDGPVHQNRQPQLFFGARGFTGFTVTVYGPTRHLHSGHYGNWAPNPGLLLAHMLAGMKAPDGRVLIEDFYEGVTPLNAIEQAAIDALPDFDGSLRAELGLAETEAGNARLDQRIQQPSLNIRGIQCGIADGRILNMIPSVARASVDIRLVKGLDPDVMIERVRAHLRRDGWHLVDAEPDAATRSRHPKIARLGLDPSFPAVRTDMTLPIVQALVRTVRAACDGPVALLPTLGGSLPLYHFVDHLGLPVVGVPIANHDNNQHGPDENLRIANLWYGIDLFAAIIHGAGPAHQN
ncbi:MAG: M20/M25/M40 family metallo-hydrolase [Rhodothermales bacterium]|nr:M20/M25/M40 family metallo-hydrolase [Rhodothermales bacterium]